MSGKAECVWKECVYGGVCELIAYPTLFAPIQKDDVKKSGHSAALNLVLLYSFAYKTLEMFIGLDQMDSFL